MQKLKTQVVTSTTVMRNLVLVLIGITFFYPSSYSSLCNVDRLFPFCPLYTDLLSAITHRVQSMLGDGTYTVNPSPWSDENKQKDKEHSGVFVVHDKDNRPVLFVKVFSYKQHYWHYFKEECAGYRFLEENNLPDYVPVNAYEVCSATPDDYYLLLATTPAPGVRVDTYLAKINNETDVLKKEIAYHDALIMLNCVARVFAALHNLSQSKGCMLTSLRYELYDNINLYKELYPEGQNSEGLANLRQLFETLQCSITRGYYHGDPHWSNIFFDAQHNTVTFLDPAGIGVSLTKYIDNLKVGYPLRDVAAFIFSVVITFSPDNFLIAQKIREHFVRTYAGYAQQFSLQEFNAFFALQLVAVSNRLAQQKQ